MTLLKLVWIFQIGLFTIGGGQVAITPVSAIVDGRYDATEFYNMVAVSESGSIGINMATYIGWNFWVWGSVIITFATVLLHL